MDRALCPGLVSMVYNAAILHEEHRLGQKYDEQFSRYRSDVPPWIPRRTGRLFTKPPVPIVAGMARCILGQLPQVAVLVPFLVKEVNPGSIWPHL